MAWEDGWQRWAKWCPACWRRLPCGLVALDEDAACCPGCGSFWPQMLAFHGEGGRFVDQGVAVGGSDRSDRGKAESALAEWLGEEVCHTLVADGGKPSKRSTEKDQRQALLWSF